ncbi:poly(hydroxyalkanoate) depolymerase family esterase [Herbaspirillum sp. SJZ107]|nr:poly(hydroxyalkanoate) depolymerase family esterase [Herbaspirillum sp. SJZ107]
MKKIMKPYEQFVANILKAAGTARTDPGAVSGLVQDALKSAGLLPGMPPPQPQAQNPSFVDLNAAPAWARKPAATPDDAGAAAETAAGGGTGFAGFPGFDAGKMAGWAAQFKAFQAGQAASHQAPAPRNLAAEPGEFLHGSFSNAAGTRAYRLYVPARAAAGPRPLVVMLHGCTQHAQDFAAGTTMNALAEEHGCLVLYPEQPRSANANGCWNWFEAAHQGREGGEPALLAGMTREVLREHGGDPGRVFVAGLSAGGAMAAILGAAYPELYAAVGVHSGLAAGSAHDLMSALNAMKGTRGRKAAAKHGVAGRLPAIVFHGDADGTVHASNGEAVLRQFTQGAPLREVEERGQDGSGRSHTRTVLLDADGRAVAEHWVLHGGGHAWSGGSTAGSYAEAGGPNASAEMLRFFLAQRP